MGGYRGIGRGFIAVLATAFASGLFSNSPADATFPDKEGKLAFAVFDGFKVGTIRVDGTHRKVLSKASSTDWVKWSADGANLVFARDNSVFVMDADGSNRTRLTSGFFDYNPTWSPTNGEIAFFRGSGLNRSLMVMNANGSDPHEIASVQGGGYPAWSPDGSQIVFSGTGPSGARRATRASTPSRRRAERSRRSR